MAEVGDNLAQVVLAWAALARSGTATDLAALLDENVRWQGVLPELVCVSRDQVMSLIVRHVAGPMHVSRIEAEERGDRVVVCVEGPDFADLGMHESPTLRAMVLTFRGDRIVTMESAASRDSAFAMLGGPEPPGTPPSGAGGQEPASEQVSRHY